MRTIAVVPYDPRWKAEFGRIRDELSRGLQGLFLAIEHVGSTSVEGLSAKPIIDIDVVIPDMLLFSSAAARLAELSYRYKGDLGIPGREAFDYLGDQDFMEHHLYVCPQDSAELRRHLAFRDYLRTHRDAVQEYGRIKQEAARLYPHDIDGYIDYKGRFIRNVYRICGLLNENDK